MSNPFNIGDNVRVLSLVYKDRQVGEIGQIVMKVENIYKVEFSTEDIYGERFAWLAGVELELVNEE